MQFKLTNMGRIGLADVTLNGITVIAGPNGSGKSTISRALFTWFNYLRQVREDVAQVRARSIGEEIGKVLEKNNVRLLERSSDHVGTFAPERFADRSFWMDENESRNWWRNNCSPNFSFRPFPDWMHENEHRAWWRNHCSIDPHLISSLDLMDENNSHEWFGNCRSLNYPPLYSYPSHIDKSLADRLYETARQCALHWLDKDELEIAQFVATRRFAKAFDEQIGTYFDEKATTEVALESDEGVAQKSFFSGGKSTTLMGVGSSNGESYNGMQMFYLEPTHMLDIVVRKLADNRYLANPNVMWEEILRKDLRRQDMSLPQAERLDPIYEELDKIVSTIHGEIVRYETKLVFRDADLPGKTVSLMNVASGAKSMAVLVRGLRNDSIHPGDFIIIDEPESNLHPEWQVSFAKFLVLLHAKFDIRFLLNTHSPYFLKAIEVYSDSYEQGDDCSYYNMVSKDGRQYDTDLVNGKLQDIFRSMSAPFSKLMRGESYERALS